MTDSTSLLLISLDKDFHTALSKGLSKSDFNVSGELSTVVGLNGKGARLAALHDIVMFDVDDDDPESLHAAREISESRASGSILIALAKEDLPLSKARELSRAGVDDVLPRNALAEEIIPQIEAWRKRQSSLIPSIWTGHASEGKVIAVAQARGGIGSSTLSFNLADVLQGTHGVFSKTNSYKVALVDLDFQFGTIAALADVEESDTLWRMAMEGIIPDAVYLDQAITVSAGGVSILTAPSRFGPLNALKSEQIGAILDVLKKSHDYIVVDLPGALVDWIEPVLSRADRLLLATDITVPSVRRARKLIDFYLSEHPGLEIELVASYARKTLMTPPDQRAATELLKLPFKHWIPNDPKAAKAAMDRGKPLSEVAPRSHIAKAIRRIGKSTVSQLAPRT